VQPEARLEELLADVKLRTPATREHVLDSLWRWESMGGGELVATLPAPTSCDGGPGCERPCLVQRPAALVCAAACLQAARLGTCQ
jgi:hypothetical protein